MNCTNPCLVEVLDTHRCNIGDRERLSNLGFKFSEDLNKAYRFAVNESRKIPLERCSSWVYHNLIELPCGSCLSCRIDYSKDWAIRCSFEAQLHSHNYFVTLTYDDDHLPKSESGNNTLCKEDISEFIQAVRNYFKHRGHTGIRYLLCGEYNSSGERMLNPHYHIILFNCPIPDLTIDFPTPDGCLIHKLNKKKMPMFYSPLFSDIWSKGFITIDDANINTEAYVSQYIMKKQKGESSSIYTDGLGVVPPFLRMSNKPGIGYNMFLKDFDYFAENPVVIIPKDNKSVVRGLPRYFKRKLFEKHPDIREKFSHDAIKLDDNQRSIREKYGTTSNQQKAYREKHLESVSNLFTRNFES